MPSSMVEVEENVNELVGLVGSDLKSFLESSGLRQTLDASSLSLDSWSETLLPTRTYVSFGAGHPNNSLTALGMQHFLDQLLSPTHLSPSSLAQQNVRFFTTTHVQSSRITLSRYPHGSLLLNNAMISARNKVLRSYPVAVIDTEGLSRGVDGRAAGGGYEWESEMGMGNAKRSNTRESPIQFNRWLYVEWVRIILTELGTL